MDNAGEEGALSTEEKKNQEQDNAKEVKEEKKVEPTKPAAEPTKQKGPARQAKSLTNLRPDECGGCGKAIRKATWYYRNGAFYCTKRCYTRKQKGETVKK